MSPRLRFTTVLLAAATAAVPASALAQADASAATQAPPSYARPSYGSDEETIRGSIVSFDGGYNLRVRDERGFIDNIELRQGTVINPTGLRLAPGMSVTVRGVNRRSVLAANQIDTPYQTYGAAPAYAYPGPYVGYPAYGYPVYGYPYGPSFSLGIGFGPRYYGRYGRWH